MNDQEKEKVNDMFAKLLEITADMSTDKTFEEIFAEIKSNNAKKPATEVKK
jgi:hypothetical protein